MYRNSLSYFEFCTMHRFIEYISNLLFLHDCVIIPDFGGFICNYKSACIDETSGIITPPSKDILFNRNLTHNDGLLANWIVCKENIPYDKAVKQVELFCEDLKIRLNQRQRIAFGDIGVFYTDRRFNIIFESGENNFLSDTYGMEEIEAPKLTTEDKRLKPQQIEIPTFTPEMSPYINMESTNWVHRSLKYGLAAAVIAGLVVITQVGIVHFGDNNKNISSTLIQPQPIIPTPVSGNITPIVKISPDYDYVEYDPLETLE